ncbi:GNAT family N-acetyltransferase [Fusibacter sp. A1]|nr:GNAT family N-acetyltransferase [Fusibacter sp. A1]
MEDTMKLEYKKVSLDYLMEYSLVPIHIAVTDYYHIEDTKKLSLDEMELRPVEKPYLKYFDTREDNPFALSDKFDLANWQLIACFDGDRIIGGALLAMDTQGVNMLKGRSDLAVIWDLRVDSNYRGMGIGKRLVDICAAEAKMKKCTEINIECQNTNVRGCNFYNKVAKLYSIKFDAYDDEYAAEAQLIWHIDLNS